MSSQGLRFSLGRIPSVSCSYTPVFVSQLSLRQSRYCERRGLSPNIKVCVFTSYSVFFFFYFTNEWMQLCMTAETGHTIKIQGSSGITSITLVLHYMTLSVSLLDRFTAVLPKMHLVESDCPSWLKYFTFNCAAIQTTYNKYNLHTVLCTRWGTSLLQPGCKCASGDQPQATVILALYYLITNCTLLHLLTRASYIPWLVWIALLCFCIAGAKMTR